MSLLYAYKPLKDRVLGPACWALQSAGVTPNMVTAAGALLSLLAGLLAAGGHLYAGIAVFLAGAFLDALDGSLARTCGLSSAFGRYFDSVLDRISELAFIAGAVVGGEPASSLLVVLGSFVLLATRVFNHRRGLSSDAAAFGRPERVTMLVAGMLAPAPFDKALFVLAFILCLFSSAQALAHGNKRKLDDSKSMDRAVTD